MDIKEKMEMLEEMLDLDEGTLEADMVLKENTWWDSMAKLSLIVLIDDEFGKKLSGDDIRALNTVEDILNCMK